MHASDAADRVIGSRIAMRRGMQMGVGSCSRIILIFIAKFEYK
jgi:hypothetical protein